MTISGALSNAMSGLRAAGRASEIISSNISNASTPGYGVRSVALSSSTVGSGGVNVDGIDRQINAGLLADLRLSAAEFENATARSSFLNRFENMLGTPDEPYSLSSRLAGFESALISAASRPDAPERLDSTVNAARDLIGVLSSASIDIQASRSEADRNIGVMVDRLNSSLAQVEEMNAQITKTIARGGDTASLMDNRQALVDEISALVPVRQVPRDNGQVALYSTGGAILLDSSAAEISFNKTNQVTPYMSIGLGTLSGLEINGLPVRTDSVTGALRGGTLGAQFEIRDELAVEAQTQIDAVARDLVERFQDPAVDPTLLAGDAGLFTDGGGLFDPIDELGLSERLTLNAAVDPLQGGESWRIRDGMNAVVAGDVGNARLLQSLSDTLTANRTPGSGNFGTGAYSAINLASALTSQVGADRYQAEQIQSFASSQFTELTQLMLTEGVDTDQELQSLILIEQTFAANARMITAVDEMMQTLLRI